MKNKTTNGRRVTIVGGGFGGVKAALELARNPDHEVVLISDRPNFQYYPTLYSAATGHSHRESWIPLGEIFAEYPNVDVFIDRIETIDTKQKIVTAESGNVYEYTDIIFALGVVTTYFNIPGLETYAHGIKSSEEIQKLKHRLYIDIAERREYDQNYVVIGAGPTGVELAAALGTYIKRLARFYEVRQHNVTIRLIEAAPRVLPRLSERSSRRVEKRLKALGVSVETGQKVEKETASEVVVSGKSIRSHTVIWTSGVTNNPFFAANQSAFSLDTRGKVIVDAQMKAAPHVYVIGDNAATPYAGLAQTALHDGMFVARNLKRQTRGQAPRDYRAVQPVSVVPVGKNWAVVEWKWLRLYGWIGGVIRRLADLVGYHDILPLGTSLAVWRAGKVYENDYFTPTDRAKKRR